MDLAGEFLAGPPRRRWTNRIPKGRSRPGLGTPEESPRASEPRMLDVGTVEQLRDCSRAFQ